MRLYNVYDFDDVMIIPKESNINSRSEVSLSRYFLFNGLDGETIEWEGIPIIASNMDTIGTFRVHNELAKHKMLTALNKHYTLDDFKKILEFNPVIYDSMDDRRVEDKFNTVKLLTSAINREMFISKSTYQALIKDCKLVKLHPVEDGHSKIADVVLEFLKEKHNGKTI
jgi:hypothetical protein